MAPYFHADRVVRCVPHTGRCVPVGFVAKALVFEGIGAADTDRYRVAERVFAPFAQRDFMVAGQAFPGRIPSPTPAARVIIAF